MEGLSTEEKRRLRAEKFGINLEEQQKENQNVQNYRQPKARHNNETRMIDDKANGMTVDELEQEIKRLQDRQQKFGGEATEEAQKRLERLQRRLDFARHKEAPKPIQEGDVISPDTLYLYGVDYMSTDDIKSYFGDRFGENGVQVTWINDSSCRVKFDQDQLAQRAFQLCSLSSNTEQRTKLIIGEAMVDQDSEQVDPRNFDVNLGWREAFGFQLKTNGRLQKLWMRFATEQDVKDDNTKGENSRYYNLQKQRRDQKLKQYGYHKKQGGGSSKGGPDNSNFIKKAIGKPDKFKGNLREKLRANEGDEWIEGLKQDNADDGVQQQDTDMNNQVQEQQEVPSNEQQANQ